jgi:hypothetical protein
VGKVIDLTLVAAVIGAVIPFLNALISHVQAPPWVRSAVAVVLATFGAIGTWASSVVGPVTVKQLIVVALGALIAAGGTAKAVTVNWAQALNAKVPGGIGKPTAYTTADVAPPTKLPDRV